MQHILVFSGFARLSFTKSDKKIALFAVPNPCNLKLAYPLEKNIYDVSKYFILLTLTINTHLSFTL